MPEPVTTEPAAGATELTDDELAAVVAYGPLVVAGVAAGLLPEQPASETAITTSMTAIRLIGENLISFPLIYSIARLLFPYEGNLSGTG